MLQVQQESNYSICIRNYVFVHYLFGEKCYKKKPTALSISLSLSVENWQLPEDLALQQSYGFMYIPPPVKRGYHPSSHLQKLQANKHLSYREGFTPLSSSVLFFSLDWQIATLSLGTYDHIQVCKDSLWLLKQKTEGNTCLPLKKSLIEKAGWKEYCCAFLSMKVTHPKTIRNPNLRMPQPYIIDAACGNNLCIAAHILEMISR